MAKIRITVESGQPNFQYVEILDVDDADVDGLGPQDRDRVLFEIAQDAVDRVVSWGYEEVPGDD